MVTLASEPGGVRAHRDRRRRVDRPRRARRRRRPAARRRGRRCAVDLGPAAGRALRRRARGWPRRRSGPLGPAQMVPWLGQYWAPHLLGARVTGQLRRRARWTARSVYAEKNWGAAFADHWWWGQAARGRARSPAGASTASRRPRSRRGRPTRLVTLAPPFARTVARAGGGEWHIRAQLAALAGRDRGRGDGARRCGCRSRSRASAGSRSAPATTCSDASASGSIAVNGCGSVRIRTPPGSKTP